MDGVPEGTEGSGLDLLGVPRDLYLLSSDLEPLRVLVEDVLNVSATAWSSDSRWLAVSLKPTGGTEGVYLLEVATGKLVLALAGRQFGAPTWLPGDASLAVPAGTESRGSGEQDVGLEAARWLAARSGRISGAACSTGSAVPLLPVAEISARTRREHKLARFSA